MDPFHFITGFGGGLGYGLVLTLLLVCGLGVPIPEDIILVSGGYIADAAGHSVWPMMLVGLAGIIAGDSIIFLVGRRIGLSMAQRSFVRRFMTPERIERVAEMFRRHGEKILVAARFMPGLRAVAFFSAGATGVPYAKFLLFDGLAALVSAPLWVFLGYRYGHAIVDEGKRWQTAILVGIAVLAVGIYVWRRWRARTAAPAPVPSEERLSG